MRPVMLTGILSIGLSTLGCSDPQFSENGKKIESTERKPKEKPVSEQKATEPNVIIGAYLTCSNAEDTNPNYSSYGCALHSQDHRKLEPPAGLAFDFAAQSGAYAFAPKFQKPESPFHVIFEIPQRLTYDLIFGADFRPLYAPQQMRLPKEMTYQVRLAIGTPQAPSPPTFNIDKSSSVKAGTELIALHVPENHTVHWTYTNDLSEDLENPSCQSQLFGESDGKILISRNIKFRAIVCSPDELSSRVRELEFTIPANHCACRK